VSRRARLLPNAPARWLAAAALALLGACHEPSIVAPPSADDAGTAAAPDPGTQFVDVRFETMYPIFLQHKIGQGPKAALWAEHYHRRWVRWTGRIRSFTPNGITLKQLAVTSTFDVSLWVNNDERAALRARYHIGDEVTYVGRFDSYDDIWRTFYLVNGSVLGRSQADLGF
jgi:hypothetical protein